MLRWSSSYFVQYIEGSRKNSFVLCTVVWICKWTQSSQVGGTSPYLWKSHNVDGMDEFHRADIEIHLVFFEDVLCAPSLKGEFPRVPLRVLFDLAAIRPQELLDPVRIVLVGRNRHRLDDRIELDPGIELLCNLAASTVVLQGDFFCPSGENVLMLFRVHRLAIRLERMINAETSYQSVADLIIGFYPHIAVIEWTLVHVLVIVLCYHVGNYVRIVWFGSIYVSSWLILWCKKTFIGLVVSPGCNSIRYYWQYLFYSSSLHIGLWSDWNGTFSCCLLDTVDTVLRKKSQSEKLGVWKVWRAVMGIPNKSDEKLLEEDFGYKIQHFRRKQYGPVGFWGCNCNTEHHARPTLCDFLLLHLMVMRDGLDTKFTTILPQNNINHIKSEFELHKSSN